MSKSYCKNYTESCDRANCCPCLQYEKSSELYKEGFDNGFEKGIEYGLDMILRFFPDPPCNYNGMDELALNEYCETHCETFDVRECWKHAIKDKWFNYYSEFMYGGEKDE